MGDNAFTRIQQDIEDEGAGGLSSEIRRAAEDKREVMVTKLTSGGCKSMESVADAVGMIRGLDFVLNYTRDKTEQAQREMNDANKAEEN